MSRVMPNSEVIALVLLMARKERLARRNRHVPTTTIMRNVLKSTPPIPQYVVDDIVRQVNKDFVDRELQTKKQIIPKATVAATKTNLGALDAIVNRVITPEEVANAAVKGSTKANAVKHHASMRTSPAGTTASQAQGDTSPTQGPTEAGVAAQEWVAGSAVMRQLVRLMVVLVAIDCCCAAGVLLAAAPRPETDGATAA